MTETRTTKIVGNAGADELELQVKVQGLVQRVTIPPGESREVPLDDDELVDFDERNANAGAVELEARRAELDREAADALTASDVWAVRALEDGVAMQPARRDYRRQLRALRDTIAAAAALDELDALELPAVPAFDPAAVEPIPSAASTAAAAGAAVGAVVPITSPETTATQRQQVQQLAVQAARDAIDAHTAQ